MHKRIFFIAAGIIILAVAVYFYIAEKNKKAATPTVTETADSLEEVTATPTVDVSSSPIEGKLPDLNPTQKTNPFSTYKNPFAP